MNPSCHHYLHARSIGDAYLKRGGKRTEVFSGPAAKKRRDGAVRVRAKDQKRGRSDGEAREGVRDQGAGGRGDARVTGRISYQKYPINSCHR